MLECSFMSGVTSMADGTDGDGNSEVGDSLPVASHPLPPGARRRKNSTSSTGNSQSAGVKGSGTGTGTGGKGSGSNVVPGGTSKSVSMSTDKFILEAMAVAGTKRGRR